MRICCEVRQCRRNPELDDQAIYSAKPDASVGARFLRSLYIHDTWAYHSSVERGFVFAGQTIMVDQDICDG